VPTVTFVSPPFRTLGLRRRESQGVPELPIAWVVHPMMNLLPDEIEALAERILPDVLNAVRLEGASSPARAVPEEVAA